MKRIGCTYCILPDLIYGSETWCLIIHKGKLRNKQREMEKKNTGCDMERWDMDSMDQAKV